MKICSKCGIEKPIDEFFKDSSKKDKHRPDCKKCKITQLTTYSKKNREKVNWHNFKYKTGVTKEEYLVFLKKQNKSCAICGRTTKEVKRLSLDHDHKTNLIRGLLCQKCNVGLGSFMDNVDFLRSAIKYLNNPPINNLIYKK